ncbi:hypothetical protein ONZ45_g13718 [Pleurotus djamor]|nr:hypothetical protein ONZ45_g13718 [Pleurotus djamor]
MDEANPPFSTQNAPSQHAPPPTPLTQPFMPWNGHPHTAYGLHLPVLPPPPGYNAQGPHYQPHGLTYQWNGAHPGPHNPQQTFQFEFHNLTQAQGPPSANTRKRTRNPNTSSAPSSKRHKHKENEPPIPGQVAQATASTAAPEVAATGVGPSQALPSTTPSHPLFRSLQSEKKPREKTSTNTSTDVWYFVWPVPSRSRADCPSAIPEDKHFEERPKGSDYLTCRLCIGAKKWSVWKNGHGQVKNIRHHLRTYHAQQYSVVVRSNQLRGWSNNEHQNANRDDEIDEGFSLEGFFERLVRWCAATDQSMNIVDSEELRDLLAFVGIGNLNKSQIPHRTKLSKLIVAAFQAKYLELIEEMQKPEAGRVSFTADAWSRSTLEGFLGITAHYMAKVSSGRLVLRSRLLAFRHIKGAHTGKNLAERFYEVLEDAKLLGKIGAITMDNASSNDTLMEHLALMLNEKGIEFDKEANRIRCFPHVINIAVKTGLRHVGHFPLGDTEVRDDEVFEDNLDDWTSTLLNDDNPDASALQIDVISLARKLISACRASGQRREAFAETIKAGNEAGAFGELPIRVVQLLRDMDAIEKFAATAPSDIESLLLSSVEIHLLEEIHTFLRIFHEVQEIVSAEQTPSLSVVIPLYDMLISILEDLKSRLPRLVPAISAAISKIQEYVSKSKTTRFYVLAMAINPVIKLSKVTDVNEVQTARKWLEDAMLTHQKASRVATPSSHENVTPPTVPTNRSPARIVSRAAKNQRSGIAKLTNLQRSLSTSSLDSNVSSTTSEAAPASDQPSTMTPEELAAQDRAVVLKEIEQWLAAGIITNTDELDDFDLVEFWNSREHRRAYPLIFKVAVDVMPMQASSVSCERVFSSAKETDTLRRSRLSSMTMEVLQFLKFTYRAERKGLSFTDHYIAREDELLSLDADPNDLHRFVAERRERDVEALLDGTFGVVQAGEIFDSDS